MILVTGASGFLGKHLLEQLLLERKPIRALYHKNKPESSLFNSGYIEWVQTDLLDIYAVEAVFKGITQVYHCAAIVSFDSKEENDIFHFNVESTSHLVNIAIASHVDKFLFVSSIAALGRSLKTQLITEDTEWEESPYNSTYSKSKYYSEMEVWRGIAEGLRAVIINPGLIIGEGNWETGTGRLFKTIDKEFPFYTAGVNAWVDVKDVARIMPALMNSNIESGRFIISAGNYSYKEIFTLMAKYMNRKPPHIKAGKLLSGLVWRWNSMLSATTGKKRTITKETATIAQHVSFYDNQKLLKALPAFQYTPIETSIKRIVEKYINDTSKK